jgi:hypothetical protein
MKRWPEGYLEFEKHYMLNLEGLWLGTEDEELRVLILMLRECLERLYEGGAQVSTA